VQKKKETPKKPMQPNAEEENLLDETVELE